MLGYKPPQCVNINGAINMAILKRTYKFRAYPSRKQKSILNRQMALAKELYNLLLEKPRAYYKETGKTLTEYGMDVWLTQIKKEKSESAELHSQVLQNVSKRVFLCVKCGISRDRDLNASMNILNWTLDSSSPNLANKVGKATEGYSGSNASGDPAPAPQKEDASRIAESGTTFGVSR